MRGDAAVRCRGGNLLDRGLRFPSATSVLGTERNRAHRLHRRTRWFFSCRLERPRLPYIAGIRDDLSPAEYEEPPKAEIGDALLDALAAEAAPVGFGDVPNFVSDDLAADLRWTLDRLRAVGIERAIVVDLTRP